MANYYVSSVKYAAVAQYANMTAYTLGQIVRQLAAPAVNSERCFRCTTAGTTGAAEGAWTLTKNATSTQGTAVFTECTGQETFQTTALLAPFARLRTAVSSAFSAAGDTIFVTATHAETQTAATTVTSAGTVASQQRIICILAAPSAVPPVAADQSTGGSLTVTTGNSITLTGSFYCYGMTFFASNAAGGANISAATTSLEQQTFDHCVFKFDATSTTPPALVLGVASGVVGSTVEMWNSNLNNAGPFVSLTISLQGCLFRWRGGTLQGGGVTTLLVPNATTQAVGAIELDGVDLSIMTTAQNILSAAGANNAGASYFNIINCKLPASYPAGTVMSGTIQAPNWGNVDMITSNATGQGSREEYYRYQGSIVADTTNYRTGGATDGVTPKSWKLVSLSNASYVNPLYAPDIYQWLPAAGIYTITLFLANTSALTLTDQQFGFDYFWMGTASVPLATFSTTVSSFLSTGAALTTDSVSNWAALVSPVKQKVAVTITVTEAGFVRLRPRVISASKTLWLDPRPVVT